MPYYTLSNGLGPRYIKDPDGYIAEQVELHGPIFQTNYFGRKTVIVGGPQLVLEFVDAEKKITKSALPNTFSQLPLDGIA